LTLPAVAMVSAAVPLSACGGDDDPETPVTTVAPSATTTPGSVTEGSSTGDTMTDGTVADGSTETTLGDDEPPVEGDTGNGTGNTSTPD
jgi:hypothetical protein